MDTLRSGGADISLEQAIERVRLTDRADLRTRVQVALDGFVVLAEPHAVLDGHGDTEVRMPVNMSTSRSPGAGMPTNERARIQSSHG